jgi:hypothetical protein
MRFLSHALDLLQDPETPPGLKEAACAALVCGLDEHLDVPAAAPLAIWHWIRESTSKRWCAAQFSLGEIPNDQVFDAAVAALRDPGSGNSLRELAYEVLSGDAHSARVPEDLLAHVMDADTGHTHQVTQLITHVHAARGLSAVFLRSVRDRLAGSPVPANQELAVEIAAIMTEPDEAFWSKMIDDPSDDVRCAVAAKIRRKVSPKFGIALLKKRLEREQVVEVQAELHRAMMVALKHLDEDTGE